jgi:glutathione S-transferase
VTTSGKIARRSRALLGPLSRSAYIAGDSFTTADIPCGYAVGLARFLGFEERLESTLRDYVGRLSQRPAYGGATSNRAAASRILTRDVRFGGGA